MPSIILAMENSNLVLEQLAARVDALLERLAQYEQSEKNLYAQINALKAEKEALIARMHEASARVSALLDKLPEPTLPASVGVTQSITGTSHEAN